MLWDVQIANRIDAYALSLPNHLVYIVFATAIITGSVEDCTTLFLHLRESSLCYFGPLYSIKNKQTGIKPFMDTNKPKIVCN